MQVFRGSYFIADTYTYIYIYTYKYDEYIIAREWVKRVEQNPLLPLLKHTALKARDPAKNNTNP